MAKSDQKVIDDILNIEKLILDRFLIEIDKRITEIFTDKSVEKKAFDGRVCTVRTSFGYVDISSSGRSFQDHTCWDLNFSLRENQDRQVYKMFCLPIQVDDPVAAVRTLRVNCPISMKHSLEYVRVEVIFRQVAKYFTDDLLRQLERLLIDKFDGMSDRLYEVAREALADNIMLSRFVFCVSDCEGEEFGLLHSTLGRSFRDSLIEGNHSFRSNAVTRLARFLLTDVPKKFSPIQDIVNAAAGSYVYDFKGPMQTIDEDFAQLIETIYGSTVVYRPIGKNRKGFCLVANFPAYNGAEYESKLSGSWLNINQIFEEDADKIEKGIEELRIICHAIVKFPVLISPKFLSNADIMKEMKNCFSFNIVGGLHALFKDKE